MCVEQTCHDHVMYECIRKLEMMFYSFFGNDVIHERLVSGQHNEEYYFKVII